MFHRDFMEYHSHRFQDFSLMVYKKEKLVALLPANVVDDVVYSHQGLTYGNLIYPKNLKTSDFIEVFIALLKFLNANNIITLNLKELPTPYLYNQSNNPIEYVLFKLEAKRIRADMHSIIDMKHKSFSNSRKEGVKRGFKYNLRVDESSDFELFWTKILIPNLQTKHQVQPVHNLQDIKSLKSKFPDQIRQFNVFYNDEIVAGTTIFENPNVAHCQYISGNSDKNELGSLDFLHHHLIENVFSDKPYFSFGTSNFNAGKHINKGLQFWKEGFGARSITQAFYAVETKNYNLLEDVMV